MDGPIKYKLILYEHVIPLKFLSAAYQSRMVNLSLWSKSKRPKVNIDSAMIEHRHPSEPVTVVVVGCGQRGQVCLLTVCHDIAHAVL